MGEKLIACALKSPKLSTSGMAESGHSTSRVRETTPSYLPPPTAHPRILVLRGFSPLRLVLFLHLFPFSGALGERHFFFYPMI